jgi:hypothetical protein
LAQHHFLLPLDTHSNSFVFQSAIPVLPVLLICLACLYAVMVLPMQAKLYMMG